MYNDDSTYYIMVKFSLHGNHDGISLSVLIYWSERGTLFDCLFMSLIKLLLQEDIVNYSEEI